MIKGDYAENSQVAFCPNKQRSFEPLNMFGSNLLDLSFHVFGSNLLDLTFHVFGSILLHLTFHVFVSNLSCVWI